MALIAINSISDKELQTGAGSNIEFDGYLSVTPAVTNVVTRRPIEDGFDLNDAVHNNPTILAVEIIITDTPQSLIDARSVTNLGNVFGTQFFKNHTQRQLDNLEAASNNRTEISLKTKYKTYDGYLIENFSYNETDEQALRISFTLVEARTDLEISSTENISKSIGLWS